MASSAFDDPDVQAAQKLYGNSAYDEPKGTTSTNNNSTMAQQVSGSIAMNVVREDSATYTKEPAAQSDHNPPPETPNWCVRVFNWVPIRWFAFAGGLLLIALAIIDILKSFEGFWVATYLLAFGVMTIIAESPSFVITRKSQLGLFFWFRLLSRTWGRAWFYIFVAITCFQDDGFSIFVGIWMITVAFAMFIYSRLAAVKYARIFIFISSGSESTELQSKFNAKFDELDLDRDQRIGSLEIVKVAAQAGRTLSNAERHAIQTFLDCSCNGSVSKEDWWKQFSTYNLKQRFL